MKPVMSGTALLRTGVVWTCSAHHAVHLGAVTHLMYSHAACLTAGDAPLNIKRLSPALPTTLLAGPAGSGAAPRVNLVPMADSTLWAPALLYASKATWPLPKSWAHWLVELLVWWTYPFLARGIQKCSAPMPAAVS